MPALPAVSAVLQLAVETSNTDSSHPIINRFYVHYTGSAPTAVELTSFATTVLTAYSSALAPSTTADKTFAGLSVIDLSSAMAAQAEVTGSVVGAEAGEMAPLDSCLVLAAKVARRYRGGHPRVYLSVGTPTDFTDGRTWNGGFVTTVVTAWNGFVTALEGAGWAGAGTLSMVNVSYYQGFTLVTYPSLRSRDVPKLRVGGPVWDTIIGYVGRTQIGSQRRRVAA